jgi:hypothetical protein
MTQQIRTLLKLMPHMLPHQRVRLVKWISHFERTGEYLTENFDRLQATVRKHLSRPKKK